MAEKTILVCDVCGKPADETVTIRANRGNFVKDLCAAHVSELVAGARKPRPGRPRAIKSASGAAASAKTQPRRRGRPPKSATPSRKKRSSRRA